MCACTTKKHQLKYFIFGWISAISLLFFSINFRSIIIYWWGCFCLSFCGIQTKTQKFKLRNIAKYYSRIGEQVCVCVLGQVCLNEWLALDKKPKPQNRNTVRHRNNNNFFHPIFLLSRASTQMLKETKTLKRRKKAKQWHTMHDILPIISKTREFIWVMRLT